MMPVDIKEQLKRGPFPLRLCFSDGSTFELRHPEFLIVTRTVLVLTIMGSKPDDLPERAIMLAPIHLVRIEPMNVNGSHRARRKKANHE